MQGSNTERETWHVNHYLRSTQGFQSQNSMTLLLPLGEQNSVPVSIDWPSGATTELTMTAGEHANVVEQ